MPELFIVSLLYKLEREVSSRDFFSQPHPGQHIPVRSRTRATGTFRDQAIVACQGGLPAFPA